jgi:photosystem II stability/assembly factor-like uncharacterized protein
MGRSMLAAAILAGLFLFRQAPYADWGVVASGTRQSLYDIQFISPDTGFAAGDSGTLLLTSDAGRNWRDAQAPSANQTITALAFRSGREGLILDGEGNVYRTETGGASWSRVAFANPDPISALFLDGQGRLFAANYRLGLYKSTDGGKSWAPSAVQGADTLGAIIAFHFPKPDTGYATSTSGVLRTNNGGDTWIQVLSAKSPSHPSGVLLTTIFFLTVQEGLAAGPYYSTIAKSQDGGRSFATLSSARANSLFFPNPDTGYAACLGGVIYRSVDRGKTWGPHFDLDRERISLRKLAFPTPQTGFAVGDSGVILRYQGGPASLRPRRGIRGSQNRSGVPAGRPTSYDSLGKKEMSGNPGARRLFRRD